MAVAGLAVSSPITAPRTGRTAPAGTARGHDDDQGSPEGSDGGDEGGDGTEAVDEKPAVVLSMIPPFLGQRCVHLGVEGGVARVHCFTAPA